MNSTNISNRGGDLASLRDTGLSRRDAILRLVSLAAGSELLGRRSLAQESAENTRFDLHHHFFPPVAKKRYGPFPPLQDYSPAKSIEAMDRAGIRTAFLSLPASLGDDAATIQQEAVGFAREANEYAARAVSDYPGRFGFFAYLPLPDIDASLREIEYAFDTIGADGVGLLTSYGNRWLGDTAFQPVFDELNRRGSIVYSHPRWSLLPCFVAEHNPADGGVEYGYRSGHLERHQRWDGSSSGYNTRNQHGDSILKHPICVVAWWWHPSRAGRSIPRSRQYSQCGSVVGASAELQALSSTALLLRHRAVGQSSPNASAQGARWSVADRVRVRLPVHADARYC